MLSDSLLNMEKKYQQKINEMQEHSNRVVQDYEEKNKKLEKELKIITEKRTEENLSKLGKIEIINKIII